MAFHKALVAKINPKVSETKSNRQDLVVKVQGLVVNQQVLEARVQDLPLGVKALDLGVSEFNQVLNLKDL